MNYIEELEEHFEKFCDLFFLDKDSFHKKRVDGIVSSYKDLFYYSCSKRFPMISPENVTKFIFRKNRSEYYRGVSTIDTLASVFKDEITLKRIKALEKNNLLKKKRK
jgi:hypothetical protein